MSHKDLSYNLSLSLDALTELVRIKSLLDIASDHADNYTPQNFERVVLLLESYRGYLEASLSDLETGLLNIQKYLPDSGQPKFLNRIK